LHTDGLSETDGPSNFLQTKMMAGMKLLVFVDATQEKINENFQNHKRMSHDHTLSPDNRLLCVCVCVCVCVFKPTLL